MFILCLVVFFTLHPLQSVLIYRLYNCSGVNACVMMKSLMNLTLSHHCLVIRWESGDGVRDIVDNNKDV